MSFKNNHEIIIAFIAHDDPYTMESKIIGSIDQAKDVAGFGEDDAFRFLKTDVVTLETRDITFEMAEAWMAHYADGRALDEWSELDLPIYVREARLYDVAYADELEAAEASTPFTQSSHGTLYTRNGKVVG